jgi:hypothetical protein
VRHRHPKIQIRFKGAATRHRKSRSTQRLRHPPVVLANQPLHIYDPPAHLLPVHEANQRLFARRIIWTHAPRIAILEHFSRRELGEVFSQFQNREVAATRLADFSLS